jgi:hypothetical protein
MLSLRGVFPVLHSRPGASFCEEIALAKIETTMLPSAQFETKILK